jgi:hypothetical protein
MLRLHHGGLLILTLCCSVIYCYNSSNVMSRTLTQAVADKTVTAHQAEQLHTLFHQVLAAQQAQQQELEQAQSVHGMIHVLQSLVGHILQPVLVVYVLGALFVLGGTVLLLTLSLERNSFVGILSISVMYSALFSYVAREFWQHEQQLAATILASIAASLAAPSIWAMLKIAKLWPDQLVRFERRICMWSAVMLSGVASMAYVLYAIGGIAAGFLGALGLLSLGVALMLVAAACSGDSVYFVDHHAWTFFALYGSGMFGASAYYMPVQCELFVHCGSAAALLAWLGMMLRRRTEYVLQSTAYALMNLAIMSVLSHVFHLHIACIGLLGYLAQTIPFGNSGVRQHHVLVAPLRSAVLLGLWHVALNTANWQLTCMVLMAMLRESVFAVPHILQGRIMSEYARVMISGMVALELLASAAANHAVLSEVRVLSVMYSDYLGVAVQLTMLPFVVVAAYAAGESSVSSLQCYAIKLMLSLAAMLLPLAHSWLASATSTIPIVVLAVAFAAGIYADHDNSTNQASQLVLALATATIDCWRVAYANDPMYLMQITSAILMGICAHTVPHDNAWRAIFVLSNVLLMSHAGATGNRLLLAPTAYGIVMFFVELVQVFRGSLIYPLVLSIGGLALLKVGTYLPDVNAAVMCFVPELSAVCWAMLVTLAALLLTAAFVLYGFENIDRALAQWTMTRRMQLTPEIDDVRLSFAPPDNPKHDGIKVTIRCNKRPDFTCSQVYLGFDEHNHSIWNTLRRMYGGLLISTVRMSLYPFALSPTYLDVTQFRTKGEIAIESTLNIKRTFKRVLERYEQNDLPIVLTFSGGEGSTSGLSNGILCRTVLNITEILQASRHRQG